MIKHFNTVFCSQSEPMDGFSLALYIDSPDHFSLSLPTDSINLGRPYLSIKHLEELCQFLEEFLKDNYATTNRKIEEGVSTEHQDGDSSRETSEAGSSDSVFGKEEV